MAFDEGYQSESGPEMKARISREGLASESRPRIQQRKSLALYFLVAAALFASIATPKHRFSAMVMSLLWPAVLWLEVIMLVLWIPAALEFIFVQGDAWLSGEALKENAGTTIWELYRTCAKFPWTLVQ